MSCKKIYLPILKNCSSNRINITKRLKLKKNVNIIDAEKFDNKSNNISISLSNKLSNSSSRNNINLNKNRNVLLTSLFNLKKINTNEDINNSFPTKNNVIHSQNNKIISSLEKTKNTLKKDNSSIIGSYSSLKTPPNIYGCKKIKIDNQSLKMSLLLKNKFYIDLEKKYAKYNKENNETKDKIIYIKKVTKFWQNLFNYMNPIFEVEKFKLKKNLYTKNNLSSHNIL